MGKLIITRRWVEERQLILTDEDWKLHDERQRRRQKAEIGARPLPYMEAFTRQLEPCPFCGQAPRISALWKDKVGFYSIKLGCCLKNCLDCGDWYKQLSRAGLDWNYRVRHQQGKQLKSVPHRYRRETSQWTNEQGG
ncbi:MAG: hypothetical protein IKD53_11675 [Clostridia bacterium]|nr:hypothetical protein [Clostridia bacterium]